MPYGNNGTFAVNLQNSFGTQNTASPYYFPILSEGLAYNKEELISEEMRGIFEEGDSYEGKNMIDAGPVTIDADIVSLGVMLRAFMGAPSTVTSDSLSVHTFKPRSADFDEFMASDPITIVKDVDTGSADVFYDCCISALTLTIANGEFLKAESNIIGGKYTQIAAGTASYPADSKYKWDVASFSLAGVANTDMLNCTIKIEDSMEAKFTINGAITPSHIKRTGSRVVTIDGTMFFNNKTEYAKYHASSTQPFDLTFTSATEVQSGYPEQIKIEAPQFRYSSFPVNLDSPGQIEVSFNGKAKYNTNSATSLAITLTTTQAGW